MSKTIRKMKTIVWKICFKIAIRGIRKDYGVVTMDFLDSIKIVGSGVEGSILKLYISLK